MAGDTNAKGYRPDNPNAVGAVSLNTAYNQGAAMRNDPDYQIVINAIFLANTGADPVVNDFLPRLANVKNIPPSIWDTSGAPYPNPSYDSNKRSGQVLTATTDSQLNGFFNAMASSLLRLSQ
jgi:hypothetical protein